MRNIIDEYLISVGAEVNKAQINEAKSALKGLKEAFEAFTKAIAAIAAGAVAAVAAVAGLTAGIIQGGKTFGNITLGVDKFALSLHTSTRNARNLQSVMDAMGIDSIDDLKYTALIPEQRAQFMSLRKLAAETAPSQGTKEGLNELKKLGFQFQRFTIKVSALGTEFLGAFGNVLKEPLFQKGPTLLQSLLDILDLLANEVIIIAKWFGNHKNFGSLASDLGATATKNFINNAAGAVGLHPNITKKNVADTVAGIGDAWENAKKTVLRFEGGYKGYTKSTGDPETNMGITAPTYAAYRKNHAGLPDLKHIDKKTVSEIYKKQYWDVFNSFHLSKPLQTAAFNAAVNMGVGATGKLLKQSHGDLGTFFDAQRARYRSIAAHNPRQAGYLGAWLARTNKLESQLGRQYPAGSGGAPITINVNGAKSPHETGKEVEMRVSHMLKTRNLQPYTA